FPIIKSPLEILRNAAMVIWTTTPWTLPGNRAIAYGENIEYGVVQLNGHDQPYVVAMELFEHFTNLFSEEIYQVLGTLSGSALKGTICAHPLRGQGYDFPVPLLPGEHVTTEAGTGLVHTAPGHGLEDFEVGQKYGIEAPATVADDGYYYD